MSPLCCLEIFGTTHPVMWHHITEEWTLYWHSCVW